jgi:hypothetical protein
MFHALLNASFPVARRLQTDLAAANPVYSTFRAGCHED